MINFWGCWLNWHGQNFLFVYIHIIKQKILVLLIFWEENFAFNKIKLYDQMPPKMRASECPICLGYNIGLLLTKWRNVLVVLTLISFGPSPAIREDSPSLDTMNSVILWQAFQQKCAWCLCETSLTATLQWGNVYRFFLSWKQCKTGNRSLWFLGWRV